jgi:hypothetical protein
VYALDAEEAEALMARLLCDKVDYAALWKDRKYLALQARKDKLGKAWNAAQAHREPRATKLGQLFDRAIRRITNYEKKACK